MFLECLFQMGAAFIACSVFSIIFNAPKRELVFCGLCASVGWIVMFVLKEIGKQPVIGTFLAAIAVTALARFLSYARKAPSTMYHIAGILPLVPGMGMYNTMWGILTDDMLYSYSQGVEVLRLAGVIGVGSIVVLALPYSAFEIIKFPEKKIQSTEKKETKEVLEEEVEEVEFSDIEND